MRWKTGSPEPDGHLVLWVDVCHKDDVRLGRTGLGLAGVWGSVGCGGRSEGFITALLAGEVLQDWGDV